MMFGKQAQPSGVRNACGLLALVGSSTACSSSTPDSHERDLMIDLTFTREGGTDVPMSKAGLTVWCGPWESDVPTEAIHIFARGPDPLNSRAGWCLTAVTADVTLGEPVTFPNYFVWDQPKGASLFAYDLPNEVSSAQTDASGSVTFEALDCSEGGSLELRIDAVLGSEFGGGERLFVRGSFSSTVPYGSLPAH